MKNIVYNTDAKWFSFLRKNGIENGVNFWRKDKRELHAPKNCPFYFKIRGSQLIAGRAKLSRIEQMTFSTAWDAFGNRNGVDSFPEFVEQVCQVTHAKDDEPISCLVLDDLEFLPDSRWIAISEQQFPKSILAFKFFEDSEFTEITGRFGSALNQKPAIEPEKPSSQELVIPVNFQGKITIAFTAGEIRIRKES